MGLMRALQGVATGYLDARVSQFEAAAEAKRKEKELADKYKAEEAMRINIQNNERIENNKLLAAEKEAERERRKNGKILKRKRKKERRRGKKARRKRRDHSISHYDLYK